ncbi:Uncharacterised protein [Slackia heliotrinireducens]|uniref:SPW repeat domain-containing protein n=1 Tax=Slackia heliotrinireducens TaxID=84110 RepID=UPI0001A373BF|nr:hypothetical protein [Slackia heliotrinireducens]VEG98922.1 Uncharacterised protein [Slackia heliotrinireducens]
MKKTLALLVAVLGAWLVVSPWFVGYADMPTRFVDMALGAVLIVLFVLLSSALGKIKQGDKTPNGHLTAMMVVGVVLVVEGIVGAVALGHSVGSVVNEIVVGVLVAAFARFAMLVPDVKKVGMNGLDDREIMLIQKIGVMEDCNAIQMRCKAFGSMPLAVKITPEQLLSLLGIIPFELVKALPKMLLEGIKGSKAQDQSK